MEINYLWKKSMKSSVKYLLVYIQHLLHKYATRIFHIFFFPFCLYYKPVIYIQTMALCWLLPIFKYCTCFICIQPHAEILIIILLNMNPHKMIRNARWQERFIGTSRYGWESWIGLMMLLIYAVNYKLTNRVFFFNLYEILTDILDSKKWNWKI